MRCVLVAPLVALGQQLLPNGLDVLAGGPGLVGNHRADFVAALVGLLLHRREVVLERLLALDAAVGDLANLVTVELGPLGPVVLIEEVDDEDGIDEVDESVAHVTVVLEVNGKVEEVVVVLLGAIDGLKQHLLGVLVRDVLDHDRRNLCLWPERSHWCRAFARR